MTFYKYFFVKNIYWTEINLILVVPTLIRKIRTSGRQKDVFQLHIMSILSLHGGMIEGRWTQDIQ
jgi:hypothetical protein